MDYCNYTEKYPADVGYVVSDLETASNACYDAATTAKDILKSICDAIETMIEEINKRVDDINQAQSDLDFERSNIDPNDKDAGAQASAIARKQALINRARKDIEPLVEKYEDLANKYYPALDRVSQATNTLSFEFSRARGDASRVYDASQAAARAMMRFNSVNLRYSDENAYMYVTPIDPEEVEV